MPEPSTITDSVVSTTNGVFVRRVDRSLTQLIQPQLTTKQTASFGVWRLGSQATRARWLKSTDWTFGSFMSMP
jgi:hypothetical protein